MQMPEIPSRFNFQTMLDAQGVTFDAGLPPPANNVTDSPMQAYHEAVQDSLSSDSEMSADSSSTIINVNCFTEQFNMQWNLAGYVMRDILTPSPLRENFFSMHDTFISPLKLDDFELYKLSKTAHFSL
jgi:hypothetical protein